MNAETTPPARYSEKLRPAWWIWLVAAGFAAAWILVFQPINPLAGVIIALVIFIALAVILTVTTAEITVSPNRVRAGRANIEPHFLSNAEPLTGQAAIRARGVEFNALSYQCLRGWVQPLVRVTVTDPNDPTPYWLISTRHPEELADAINAASAASAASSGS